MEAEVKKNSLKSRIIKTEPIDWRALRFIQQDKFKDLDLSARHRLKSSLVANNFSQPFYVWEDEDNGVIYCLDGKHRTALLEELIAEGYDVPYLLPATFVECENKKEAARLVLIYSSVYARISQEGLFDFVKEYDFQMSDLNEQIDIPDFDMPSFEGKYGFSSGETEITDETREEARKSLRERFVVPPFSVLDTRQGYWQERKRKWLDLGIKSDESRKNLKAEGSFAGSVPRYYTYKEDAERKLGRELTHKEFAECYLPEYFADSSLEYTDNGAILSVFDPVLCEVMYRWFCVNGGQIFDPFAGGSVRGIVAGMLGYGYLGIDLRKEQVEANERQKREIAPNADIQWITGNSINTSEICGGIKADFVFSCPPYFDLEVYSDDEEDLSNMEWDKFREQYGEIIRQSVSVLKDDSFACFVVGEVRDKKTGYYRKLINETVNAFERAGAAFYNELILVNVAGSLPIRAATTFKSRKIGKCHQNVLVFYKGDVSKIKSKFPDSDFSIAGPDFISENQ